MLELQVGSIDNAVIRLERTRPRLTCIIVDATSAALLAYNRRS